MSEASRHERPRARYSLHVIIFVAGMSFSILGSMLPDVAGKFGLSNREASTLVLAQFSGDFLGLVILGVLIKWPRRLVLASVALLSVSSLGIALTSNFSSKLLAVFFAFGIASGIVITTPGMIVSRLAERGRAARDLNVFFAFFSAGVMAAPLFSGTVVSLGLGYREAFAGLTLLSALVLVFSLINGIPRAELGDGLAPSALKELFTGHWKVVAAVVLMNLCYVGAEAVPNAWIPKYLHDTFPGSSEFRSTLVLALFWAAITGGRFVCAWLIGKGMTPRRLLGSLAVLSALCLLVAPMLNVRILAEALFVLSGLFFSGMFPVIISYTERIPEKTSGTLFILVMAAGMLGASGAGRAVGVIAEAVSFGVGMGLAALLSAMILVLMPLAEKHSRA